MWPHIVPVNGYRDKEDGGGFFSCPQCGRNFTARPILKDCLGNLCCKAILSRRGFLHREEAEGCQVVLGVPGLIPSHSPAAPKLICSLQKAPAGGSLCIPAREKLHPTGQDVGSVLLQRWPVHLPALCNG